MRDKNRNAVAVLGATGFTGQLIAARLAEKNIPMVLAGRNAAKLAALQQKYQSANLIKTMIASPDQPTTLAALCEPPVAVLINCAGPFTDLGEPVVQAALDAGIHYLDITGEQLFIARIMDKYHARAVERGCLIIPACGFEYAVGNWAATYAASGLEPLQELNIAVTAKNVSTSRGTQLSALKLLANPGYGWQKGRRVARLTAFQSKKINFPAPFGTRQAVWVPFGDLITLPRHIQVENINGYMALPTPLATPLRLIYPLLPAFSTMLSWGLKILPNKPQPQAFEWLLQVEAISAKGNRVINLRGRDVYGLTAVITIYAAEQILAGNYSQTGVLGPAHAFKATEALHMLLEAGVTMLHTVL